MPLTPEQIHELNARAVVILNHEGDELSMGHLVVPQPSQGDASLRVELSFETDEMSGTFRIPATRFDELAASWDGATYRYRLPPGTRRWTQRKMSKESMPAAQPIIETFEVPTPQKSAALRPEPKPPGR